MSDALTAKYGGRIHAIGLARQPADFQMLASLTEGWIGELLEDDGLDAESKCWGLTALVEGHISAHLGSGRPVTALRQAERMERDVWGPLRGQWDSSEAAHCVAIVDGYMHLLRAHALLEEETLTAAQSAQIAADVWALLPPDDSALAFEVLDAILRPFLVAAPNLKQPVQEVFGDGGSGRKDVSRAIHLILENVDVFRSTSANDSASGEGVLYLVAALVHGQRDMARWTGGNATLPMRDQADVEMIARMVRELYACDDNRDYVLRCLSPAIDFLLNSQRDPAVGEALCAELLGTDAKTILDVREESGQVAPIAVTWLAWRAMVKPEERESLLEHWVRYAEGVEEHRMEFIDYIQSACEILGVRGLLEWEMIRDELRAETLAELLDTVGMFEVLKLPEVDGWRAHAWVCRLDLLTEAAIAGRGLDDGEFENTLGKLERVVEEYSGMDRHDTAAFRREYAVQVAVFRIALRVLRGEEPDAVDVETARTWLAWWNRAGGGGLAATAGNMYVAYWLERAGERVESERFFGSVPDWMKTTRDWAMISKYRQGATD